MAKKQAPQARASGVSAGIVSRAPRGQGRDTGFRAQRLDMVEQQLVARGIRDSRVLAAMAAVPREAFVPKKHRSQAYGDHPLPIGGGQTISQPWIVAAILQALALNGGERVLEVGTGSGYSAALLGRLAGEVITVEYDEGLAETARATLAELGVDNVQVITGDGGRGVPEQAPFQAIAVHALTPEVPAALVDQLAAGGRIVVPLADGMTDMLVQLTEADGQLRREDIVPCTFVPLTGDHGYPG